MLIASTTMEPPYPDRRLVKSDECTFPEPTNSPMITNISSSIHAALQKKVSSMG